MAFVTDPESLFSQLEADKARKRPPIAKWHPAQVGASAMRIASDGRWFHQGSEIRRREMVKLFSTILRRDGAQHYLVTPEMRLSIEVDDAPFVAVDAEALGEGTEQRLAFLTNVDDVVEVDGDHPISLRGDTLHARPYILVRDALCALISRPAFYRLATLAIAGPRGVGGVWSNRVFFDLEIP